MAQPQIHGTTAAEANPSLDPFIPSWLILELKTMITALQVDIPQTRERDLCFKKGFIKDHWCGTYLLGS